ncbi:gluconate 2-dehydrogenase subunit 3 family protein [Nocardioides aquiterrae]|uniref:Gluconate 2-dehydrogenase subunit 3 family protein n=1 Tax=Nocardioides aquiterrae TaxID=203799 RepID=A0ABP4EU78_9ACTN
MSSKADWKTVLEPVDPDSDERLFFSQHQWDTVEALSARIIPTDHDPGAREARVVVFIDRYLSGINYIFAAADGSGFLQIDGPYASAWRSRITDMQRTYREGLAQLDALCTAEFGSPFVALADDDQDRAIEILSGRPKPGPVTLGTTEPAHTFTQFTTDDGLSFFDALCLHVKQGFYADPVYGGNKDRQGWRVIGFEGPASLKDTMDGTYSTDSFFVQEYEWTDLIPHLKVQTEWEPPS